jgi:uncharacterized coiled-coil protein SlyX
MTGAEILSERIDALARQMARLNERIDEAATGATDATNERPPHY